MAKGVKNSTKQISISILYQWDNVVQLCIQ